VPHLEENCWILLLYKAPVHGTSKFHKNVNCYIQEYLASRTGLLITYLISHSFYKNEKIKTEMGPIYMYSFIRIFTTFTTSLVLTNIVMHFIF
jgi:hypothetical protein